VVTEQGDGGAERFGGGIDATLTATGSKACGLVETESELVFNEEVLKGSGQRASGSARCSCPLQECLGVSRVTGGEERSHGGDELAGPADGHAFGRVVGERSKPPRRFGDGGGETVGGTDADVATAIWDTMPGGIQPYGSTSYSVTGEDGAPHAIGFSRPVPKYAHVEVSVVSVDPDGGPVGDYEQAIKDAVSLYGNANFDLGDNFTLQKLFAPIYSVPGIYSVTLRIATTTTAAGTPTWSTSNILVAAREYLTFDSARVTVL